MIINIYNGLEKSPKQFTDLSKCCYRVTPAGEYKIAVLADKIQGNERIFELQYNNGYIEKTYYSLLSPLSKQLKKGMQGMSFFEKTTAYFVLDGNNKCLGKSFQKINKLKNHKRITFNSEVFQYGNKVYDSARIKTNNGLFYVVFRDGKNIAVIHNRYTENSNIVFTIYSSEEAPELIHLAVRYFFTEIYDHTRDDSYGNCQAVTVPKEMQNLYDPNFIPYVKSLEGIM